METGSFNRDEDGQPIFVKNEEDLLRAWNSPSQRAMRLDMAAGREPAGCQRCFQMERHGLQSLREIANLDNPEGLKRLPQIDSEGALDPSFFSIDLRLGNLCNLRCQMCNPVSSRKLEEDFQLLYPGRTEKIGSFDWFQNEKLLEMLLNHAESIREIHLAGGEPFLIPEAELLVRKIVEKGAAKNCRLSFNTNATVLPEKLFSLFSHFASVRLILSLDGVGKVNDYIRFPSKYSQIAANLARLSARREEFNLSVACFNVTVQVHNLFHLPDLIRQIGREYPGLSPFPVLSPLRQPSCLSVQVLPPEAKQKAKAALEDLILAERSFWKSIESRSPEADAALRFERHILGLIDFLFAEDKTDTSARAAALQ
jgi:sulfatase maturation enzyme AslB (radical SAM superfamily)